MTKYTVEWLRGTNEGLPRVDKYIAEADGVLDAFDKAVDKYKHSAYPQIFISWDGWNKCFDNPHYDPKAVTGKTKPSHSVKHSRTGGTLQSSGWAKLYRFFGVLNFLFGLITTIVVAQKYEYEGFLWGVYTFLSTLGIFLFAFLINVLTDMREYLKRIAEKQ